MWVRGSSAPRIPPAIGVAVVSHDMAPSDAMVVEWSESVRCVSTSDGTVLAPIGPRGRSAVDVARAAAVAAACCDTAVRAGWRTVVSNDPRASIHSRPQLGEADEVEWIGVIDRAARDRDLAWFVVSELPSCHIAPAPQALPSASGTAPAAGYSTSALCEARYPPDPPASTRSAILAALETVVSPDGRPAGASDDPYVSVFGPADAPLFAATRLIVVFVPATWTRGGEDGPVPEFTRWVEETHGRPHVLGPPGSVTIVGTPTRPLRSQ